MAGWVARIESDEFREFDSFRAKCRALAWRVCEESGDLEITEADFDKLVNVIRSALLRWYENQH